MNSEVTLEQLRELDARVAACVAVNDQPEGFLAGTKFRDMSAAYVRQLLSTPPDPGEVVSGASYGNRNIYPERDAVHQAVQTAAPALYHALKNLMAAARERDYQQSIESVVWSDAEQALHRAVALEAAPKQATVGGL